MGIRNLPTRVAPMPGRLDVVQGGQWRGREASSSARGYGWKWQQERKAYLQEHPFCLECMRERKVEALGKAAVIVECATRGIALPWANVVDHIIPHRGNQNAFWNRRNWQPLCAAHHNAKTGRGE